MLRSFDAPHERPAPRALVGRTLDGEEVSLELGRMTLVAAVKSHCDGCRTFLESDLAEFANVDVVIISATQEEEYRASQHVVIVAPDVMVELEIRAAPFYVLIDSSTSMVVAEGSIFSPAQVASEIAPYVVS